MTPSQKLRSIADSTGLDGIADAIREIANEIEHNNAPAVPQGEPVACLVRQRTLRTRAAIAHDGQDHFSEWSDWYPATLKYGTAVTDPRRNSGPEHLFEMLPLVLAAPAPAVPQTVYLVENRTCLLAYASREDADKAVASMPASVGGGFLVSPVQVFGAPAPAPAQEVATLSLSAEDVHAAFTKNFPKTRISQAWISFAADIAQAIATRAAKPAQEVGLTEQRAYRLLQAGIDQIEAADEFLSDDTTTWAIDPNGIFVGATYMGNVLRPARRAIIAALRAKGAV